MQFRGIILEKVHDKEKTLRRGSEILSDTKLMTKSFFVLIPALQVVWRGIVMSNHHVRALSKLPQGQTFHFFAPFCRLLIL